MVVLNSVLLSVSALDQDQTSASVQAWHEGGAVIVMLCVLIFLCAALSAALLHQLQKQNSDDALHLENEERIAIAAGSANIGLWYWDVGAEEIWITDRCREILGLGSDENLNLTGIFNAIDPAELGVMRAAVAQGVNSEKPFDLEQRITGESGDRWLHIKGQLMPRSHAHEGHMQQRRVTGTIEDITDERVMQQNAVQQNQQLIHLMRVGLVGELSGALAHELNQPLTSILSNAQAASRLVERQPADMQEVKEILDDIVSENRRAVNVIARLRALLKKDKTHFEIVRLDSLIAEVLHLAHSELVLNNVEVVENMNADLPAIYGDPIQLQQVFLNLVINACDAMSDQARDNRKLLVTASRDDLMSVKLTVTDNGGGIQDGRLYRVFEPFFTTKERGMGLGLSISRSIVETHGGRIWARNNKPAGTTFSVSLPIAARRRA